MPLMLSVETSAAIFAAERLDDHGATRMATDPRREVVDLAINSAPAVAGGVVGSYFGE